MSKIVWCEVTRNCHIGRLDDVPVATVERSQKNRPDGTKHDWNVIILGDRYTWNKTFCQHDPHDLESTKTTAEARVKWAIGCLYSKCGHAKFCSFCTAKDARRAAFEEVQAILVKPEHWEERVRQALALVTEYLTIRDDAGPPLERAHIVAWLRSVGTGASLTASTMRKVADDIERCEHMK